MVLLRNTGAVSLVRTRIASVSGSEQAQSLSLSGPSQTTVTGTDKSVFFYRKKTICFRVQDFNFKFRSRGGSCHCSESRVGQSNTRSYLSSASNLQAQEPSPLGQEDDGSGCGNRRRDPASSGPTRRWYSLNGPVLLTLTQQPANREC